MTELEDSHQNVKIAFSESSKRDTNVKAVSHECCGDQGRTWVRTIDDEWGLVYYVVLDDVVVTAADEWVGT